MSSKELAIKCILPPRPSKMTGNSGSISSMCFLAVLGSPIHSHLHFSSGNCPKSSGLFVTDHLFILGLFEFWRCSYSFESTSQKTPYRIKSTEYPFEFSSPRSASSEMISTFPCKKMKSNLATSDQTKQVLYSATLYRALTSA